MITPEFLKPGDTIGLISPAGIIDKNVVMPAIDLLESLGYKVLVGKHAFEQSNQFAGTDEHRASDLQEMIDNPDVKAIICNRGGYGSLRTAEMIDWEPMMNNPKWIVGFSDITVFHSKMNQLGIKSVHGPMVKDYAEGTKGSPQFQSVLNALSGIPNRYEIPFGALNRFGEAQGIVVGGNLSILYSLRGTPFDIDTNNKILFIEDLSEYLYHLDRMMMNLKVGGKLKGLKGLIVGGFTNMKDNERGFGMTVEEIIRDAVKEYDFPVLFGFPGGHQKMNFALKMGGELHMEVSELGSIVVNP